MMIDRAKHIVPGLTAIDVALHEATDDMPAGVILWKHRDDMEDGADSTQQSWIEWMAATFRRRSVRTSSFRRCIA